MHATFTQLSRITWALVCAAMVVVLPDRAHARELLPADVPVLIAGDTVLRLSEAPAPADGFVFAAIDIPAPPARVWSVLTDCARAPLFMPNLKSCKVIEADPAGNADVREHRITWTSFLPDVRSVFSSRYVPGRRINFSRVEGDLSHLEGEWRLEPIAGGRSTRLVYATAVGFHALVPSFLVRSALERDIPGFLRTIRDEVLRRG